MRVMISTVLNTSADRAWSEVQTARLLEYVAWPVLTFKATGSEQLPTAWREGTYPVRLLGFCVIPLGQQRIVTTMPMPGPERFQIRDNGEGDLVSRWDHLITIERTGPDRCRYTDAVAVEAGILTPLMWAFACLFYAHRQRRWRKLVRSGFTY